MRSRPAPAWTRAPDAFAAALLVVGALAFVAAISTAFGARVHPVRYTINALVVPVPANLGYAAFVVTIAAGVANRKRVASWMLLAYFALQAVFDVWMLADHDEFAAARRPPPGIPRRWSSTRTSSRRSSTPCRRPGASGSASTVSSCC